MKKAILELAEVVVLVVGVFLLVRSTNFKYPFGVSVGIVMIAFGFLSLLTIAIVDKVLNLRSKREDKVKV